MRLGHEYEEFECIPLQLSRYQIYSQSEGGWGSRKVWRLRIQGNHHIPFSTKSHCPTSSPPLHLRLTSLVVLTFYLSQATYPSIVHHLWGKRESSETPPRATLLHALLLLLLLPPAPPPPPPPPPPGDLYLDLLLNPQLLLRRCYTRDQFLPHPMSNLPHTTDLGMELRTRRGKTACITHPLT